MCTRMAESCLPRRNVSVPVRRLPSWICAVVVLVALLIAAQSWDSINKSIGIGSASAQQAGGNCGLAQPAFCDTFDQPFNGGGRTGQLDPSRWTIARIGNSNPKHGFVNFFIGSNAMPCKTPVTGVMPDSDYFVCGVEFGESNHFLEACDDQGGSLH